MVRGRVRNGSTYRSFKGYTLAQKFGRLRSVMEATERMHPIPPPFNLPVTCAVFMHNQCTGTVFGMLFPSGEKEHRPYDYKTNKNLKGKIARALMLKFKRQQEEGASLTLDGYAEMLAENQKEIKQEILELQVSLAHVKRAVDKPSLDKTPRSDRRI